MLIQYLCLVLLFTPKLYNGMLTLNNVKLIKELAEDLRFTCIMVIFESVDEIINTYEINLMKSIPTVFSELDDLEKIYILVKKEKNICVNFSFIRNVKLQVFLRSLSGKYSTIFVDSTWYFWQSIESTEIDPKLVGLNSDVNYLVEKNGQTLIKEVYSLNINQTIIENVYGAYNSSAGLVWMKKDKWPRRNNLHGALLKAIVLKNTGYLSLDKVSSKYSLRNVNKVAWSGIVPDIFESMAVSMNFTYSLMPPRDGKWGSYDAASDTWNGAVKDLMEGVADVAPISLFMSHIRSTAVDFSIPIISSNNVFLVSNQPSYSWDIFLRPFHSLTWIVLYITIIVLSGILTLITRYGREEKIEEFRLVKCFVFVYGAFSALAARRWSTTPMKTSGR